MEKMKFPLRHAGFFLLTYIPVVLFLTPMRAWLLMGLMGIGLALCIFSLSFYLEHGGEE